MPPTTFQVASALPGRRSSTTTSALGDVVDAGCGAVVPDRAPAFAGAVRELAARPGLERRRAARVRAERFGWPRW